MCGLAGFLDRRAALSQDEAAALARRMGDTLVHRGPDDGAVWVDAPAGIGLAHRRLSIVDLSPLGRQPMASSCGRWQIAFNGEIYNFTDLRPELEALGRPFRGHSDTEVILEGCAAWGVEATIRRLWGMFAISLWDRETRTLTLVRDRLGIKPLYWGQFGGLVVFGSELKALVAHGGWTPQIDRDALTAYLRFAYVPAPRSIWTDVYKLEPGHMIAFRPDGSRHESSYWSASAVARTGIQARGGDLADTEATDRLEHLLDDTIGRHMVADVPLGAFLSGGYDSTAVVALMQARSQRPVKTFTIGFHEGGYNEAEHAKAVARHLGTDHTELYVEPAHALEIVPRLPEWYDEPFADSSQIPTFLVSEMTRAQVTVALSGDGGDELFAGYSRYSLARSLWRTIRLVPRSLRPAAAWLIHALPPSAWDRMLRVAPARLRRPPQAGDKLYKLAAILGQNNDALYRGLVSQWHEPEALVVGGQEPTSLFGDQELRRRVPDFLDRMQLLDLVTYLPDAILTKVDRASMAVALEARVPLLDHRVVEFTWALPQRMKMRGGESKWLLRQVLYRHVPRALMDRPKMGFGVPIKAWLRGPLRDWAEDLLAEDSLRADGLLNPAPIRARWAEHLSDTRNWHYPLWTVLMFQAWKRRWG